MDQENAAQLAQADAFFLVVDKESARAPNGCIRKALHETQIAPFDKWLSDNDAAPILAFGRVFHRTIESDRVLAGLPMAFCRNIEAFAEFLTTFHANASSDPLTRVKASAFLVLISDKGKANAVRAIIAELVNRRRQ